MEKDLRERKFRNKDHDNMMSYLRGNKHSLNAWNYHANRATDYIDKLESKLALLSVPVEKYSCCYTANKQGEVCPIHPVHNSIIADYNKELDRVRILCAEKDSEIAELKLKAADRNDWQEVALKNQAEIARLRWALQEAYHAIRSEESIVGNIGFHIKRAYDIIDRALEGE